MTDNIALVIGASSESIHAIKKAKEMEYFVLAFDGDKNAEGLMYADEQYVTDIRNPQNIINIIGNHKPSIVLPIPIGKLVVTGGAINDFYQLKGVCQESCELCTDKYKFHNVLSALYLRNTKCYLVQKGKTEVTIPREYPVIIKPRYGSGNRAVYVARSKDEFLYNFVNNLPYNEDVLVETLINGDDEYGIDGAIINGSLHIILLRKKIITPYPMRQCVGYYSVVPTLENEDFFKYFRVFLENIIVGLKMDNCLFHADVIYKEECLFLIEISPRPSGHHLHDYFTILATGVDMIKEYIKYISSTQMTYSFVPKYTKKLLIRYFDFENCEIIKMPNAQTMLEKYPLLKYQCNIKNEYLGKVCDGSIVDRGFFVLEGTNDYDLDKYAQEILNEFEVKING